MRYRLKWLHVSGQSGEIGVDFPSPELADAEGERWVAYRNHKETDDPWSYKVVELKGVPGGGVGGQ